MKVELAHDILAKKVYDKASSEDKLILKIEQLIRQNYNRYRERDVLMSADDLDYIQPFLEQVHIPSEQNAFIQKSQNAVEASRKRLRLMWAAIFLFLAASTVYSIWQYSVANEQRQAAEAATRATEKLRVAAVKSEKAAISAKDEAYKQRDRANELQKEADKAKLDALAQRDSVLIIKRKIESALKEVQRQKNKAERQRIAADSAKAQAEQQKLIAEQNLMLAKENQEKAEKATEEANIQKDRAIKSEKETKELYEVAQARSKSNRAIRLMRGGKIEEGVNMALEAHDTLMRYAPNEPNADNYTALLVAISELQENKRANLFNEHKDAIRIVAHHPEKPIVASADESGKIFLWNWISNKKIAATSPPSSIKRRLRSLNFTPNGKKIVGGTTDGELLAWQYDGKNISKKSINLSANVEGIIEHIDFPNDPKHAHHCVFSVERQVYLLNTKTKKIEDKITLADSITAFKLSYLGQFLLVATKDIIYQFQIDYDGKSKKFKEIFKRQKKELKHVTALSLHSKSGKLAIGNKYGTVWVTNLNSFINDTEAINMNNGETEHRSKITGLDFSQSGYILVSSSLDRTAKIWDAQNIKNERLILFEHTDWIWGCNFVDNNGNEKILTYSEDKTVRIWEINSINLSKKVKKQLTKWKNQ